MTPLTTGPARSAVRRSTLSPDRARRLAVDASCAPHLPDAAAVLTHLGLLQLDPLTRVDKAHRLTCWARLHPSVSGPQVDAALWADGPAVGFETWVHAVCLVPVADWPLLRLARERALASPRRPAPAVLAQVLDLVEAHPDGATISDLEDDRRGTRGWEWSERKHAVEHLVRSGELVCTARRGTKRVFDLPGRRIPAAVLEHELSREQILAALARRAVTAMGIATAADVATYYNLSTVDAVTGLQASPAEPVTVEGWAAPAWLDPVAPIAEEPADQARPDSLLVGPFDNLIWDRDRTRRLFDFDYVFEAYKPAARRTYGYYVLAVLGHDRFLGRVDLRRDRDVLTVLAAHPEPGVPPGRFDDALQHARARLQRHLSPAAVRPGAAARARRGWCARSPGRAAGHPTR